MRYEVHSRPSYAVVAFELDGGESIRAEPGALLSRNDRITVDTKIGGGGIAGTLRRAVSDERSLTSNRSEATADGARLTLAPDAPGDVVPIDLLETGSVRVQSGSLLAWSEGVEQSTKANDARNIFSSGELTVLGLSGDGVAFLTAAGAVHESAVESDDPLFVDEGHLVAWTEGLSVSRVTDGGVKSAVLGGEGRLTRLDGDGRVWLQTRKPGAFRGTGGQ